MLFINYRTGAAVLVALHMFLLPVIAPAEEMNSLKKKPLPIDFNDVIEKKKLPLKDAKTSVIRIAVAAMISPQSTYRYYIKLLNLIGARLGGNVAFIQKKTYAEVNDMLKRRELEIAFVCSGPYVSGKKEFGMEIIAVPVCHGRTVYYSYFIVSTASGINSMDNLRGMTFAFSDPLSNTGYLVPTYYLARRNESPETFFGKTFFTHSHDNSIQAVVDGVADGAAVDSLIFDFILSKKPESLKKIRVIEKSPPYGIPPIVVHPSMDPAMKKKLKDLFFTFHESPEGKTILENLQIDRFVEGDDGAYDSVRELQHYLESKS